LHSTEAATVSDDATISAIGAGFCQWSIHAEDTLVILLYSVLNKFS